MDHSAHAHCARADALDPVCGMKVEPSKSRHRHTHEGYAYFFCSTACHGRFAADPATYLAVGEPSSAPEALAGVIYTCPMHPEIRRPKPGSCPICGMAPMRRDIAEKKLAALAEGAALARKKFS